MRARLVSSLLMVIAACGGSKKPAEPPESPSPETSSSASSDTATESDSGSAEAPAASSEPAEAPETAPAAANPSPTVTGTIDGKPFVPKLARITHPMQKDGRVVVTLDERTDCGGGDAKPGEGILNMTVTLEDGYKVDLGSLKRGGKKGGGEISFVRVGAGGKKDFSASFKPTGRVTIVKAPMEQNAVGKLNLDLTSGDYMLSGDLDLQACVAPKGAAKGGPKKKK
ncbi:MAG TPA: hypothetical protein VN894_02140 [Polyangiaceae bacterium]|nr:hypothetical protein [Polyangiaceae bacterium]